MDQGELPITEIEDRYDGRTTRPWCRRKFRVVRTILCHRAPLPVSVLVLLLVLTAILLPITIVSTVRYNQAHSLSGSAGRLGMSSPVPYPLSMLRDVDDYPISKKDIPFVWIVPQGGTGAVDDVIQECYGLKSAREAGTDVFHLNGLEAMVEDQTIYRKDVDFVYSNHLHQAAKAFSDDHPGRLIASFRHPHERVSSIYMRRKARGDAAVANLTFSEFVDKKLYSLNWVTRFIADQPGKVTDEDLELAKNFLWRKCLVMIAEEPEESVAHLEKYFGWTPRDPTCTMEVMERDGSTEPILDENTEVWKKLNEQNKHDVELYMFAQYVFQMQGFDLDTRPSIGSHAGAVNVSKVEALIAKTESEAKEETDAIIERQFLPSN